MPRNRSIHALLIYLLLAAGLMPFVKWYANNPDTFQYLSLAHRYADGSFLNIVNAYWSPLIIWLLIVPIKIFGNGIIAFKILQISIGAVALFGWHRLLRASGITGAYALLLFAAIPFLLAHGLLMLTADLLFLCIGFFILTIAIEGRALATRKHAIIFGCLGGLWYLSKAFAFPLFIVFLAIIAFWEWRRSKSVTLFKNGLIAIACCSFVAAPWVLAMSMKYGYLTISEAARFNETVEVAPMPGEIKRMPLLTDGPHHPPPGAISPWESPGDVVQLTPLRPWTDPSRYVQLIKRNLLTIYYYDIRRQIGTPFLVVMLLAMFIRRTRTIFFDRMIILPLLFLLVLNLGYAAILVHDRYIWINTFIMLLLSAKLLESLIPKWPPIRNMILLALILLAIKRPVKQIFFTEDADLSASHLISSLLAPIETLERTYHPDHVRADAIDALRPLRLQGSLASLHSADPVRHAYSSSLHIAYELGLTYHGEILPHQPIEQQLQDLQEHDIRYFAVWENMHWEYGKPLLETLPPGPRIFQLK